MTGTPDLQDAFPRLSKAQLDALAAAGERRPTRAGEVLYRVRRGVGRMCHGDPVGVVGGVRLVHEHLAGSAERSAQTKASST
jgi:hypothetical protein